MCGFLAEFSFENKPVLNSADFNTLLNFSKHRGPDDTGVFKSENFQLGFNRLAILDISNKGNQPKQSPNGRYHIVFNGEIYNYKSLSKAYQLTNLNSSSDTEVIIHLLDKLGIQQTILQLNGMFAMTIVDTKTNNFYLTRDFAGIKPLFYGLSSQGAVSASQFNQIYKHPWFYNSLKLRKNIVKEYFGFGYMQAPNTIYESIFQVNPGELVQIDIHGHVKRTELTSFAKTQKTQESKTTKSLKTSLKKVVNRQLVSDVSVATFLSGGIDSPLISAYAKKSKSDIEAFTIKVNDVKLNESDIAQDYAKALDLKQVIVSVEDSDLLKSIDEHFKAYSEPFGDYSSIPTYVICKEAKKRHTVMLSGDGGDELFFGYPRMRDVLKKRIWFIFPYHVRKILAKITNSLKITNTWAPYIKNFNAFVINKHLHLPNEVLDKAFLDTHFSQEIKSLYSFANNSRKSLLHELRWNEFYAHMQRVLIKVDRASMKHSLEVRVPFLDKESITNAWQLSSNLDTKKDLKKELKVLLEKELPLELINKKKMGFTVPLYDWLHSSLKADVFKQVFDTPFYGERIFDASILKSYVEDFYDRKHENSWGVWHIYAWQKWAGIHV